MRNRSLSLLVLLLCAGIGRGEEREPATTTDLTFSNLRMERGVRQAGTGVRGDAVWLRESWSLEIEGFHALRRSDPSSGRMRAAMAWSTGRRSLVEAFVTAAWVEQVRPCGTRGTFETGLATRWNSPSGWGVELAAAHEFRRRAQHVSVTLHYSLPLKKLGAFLEWRGSGGAVTARDLLPDAPGPAQADSYLYYETSLRLPYRIGGRTTVYAEVQLAGTSSQHPDWSSVSSRGRTRVGFALGWQTDF